MAIKAVKWINFFLVISLTQVSANVVETMTGKSVEQVSNNYRLGVKNQFNRVANLT